MADEINKATCKEEYDKPGFRKLPKPLRGQKVVHPENLIYVPKVSKADSNLSQYRQRVQAREVLKKPEGIHAVSDAYKILRKPVEKSDDVVIPKDIHSSGKTMMLPGEHNGPLFQSPVLKPGTLRKAMSFVMKEKDNPSWKAAEKKIIEMVNRRK